MPPNTGSTSVSERNGTPEDVPPKRKLRRSSNQLKRNAACKNCHKRRIKCDAGKPHCSSCVRSFQFLARTQPDRERDAKGVQCFYQDEEDESEATMEPHSFDHSAKTQHSSKRKFQPRDEALDAGEENDDARGAIKYLEARVAELQQALQSASPPNAEGSSLGSATGQIPTVDWSKVQSIEQQQNAAPPSLQAPGWNDFLTTGYQPPSTTSNPVPPLNDVQGIDLEAGKLGGQFLELFWPGWPPRLPTPAMLDHLVDTFFTMVPSVSRILHRSTFTARLALPPSHPDFPHVALLHTICAVAGRFSAAVYTDPVEDVVRKTNEDMAGLNQRRSGASSEDEIANIACFAERNARYAIAEMRFEEAFGPKLLEILQAQTLMVNYYTQHAKWIEGWNMTGAASRGAIPLGLMLEGRMLPGVVAVRTSLLPPPKNDREREERRALMYTILSGDIVTSASSGWSNSIPYEEVGVALPCGVEDFERGFNIPENPQKFHSPDLYSNHPVVDSHVMLLKGIILLGRITKFVRCWRAAGDDTKLAGKNGGEFRKLDADIAVFRMTFPPALRDILQPKKGSGGGIDADLISAHLVPHVASILLNEPFADLSNPTCSSAARLLMDARSCLSIAYVITSTSMDIRYMIQTISSLQVSNAVFEVDKLTFPSYFFTAARTLLLFYQKALDGNDVVSANMFLSEIKVFQAIFDVHGTRFPLGFRHAAMLERMIAACKDGMNNSTPTTLFAIATSTMDAKASTTVQLQTVNVPHTQPWDGSQYRPFERQLKEQMINDGTDFTELLAKNGIHALHPDAVLYSSMRSTSKFRFRDLLNVKRGFIGTDRSIEYPRLVSDGAMDILAPSVNNSVNHFPSVAVGSAGAPGMQDWGVELLHAASANVTLLSPDSAPSRGSSTGTPS